MYLFTTPEKDVCQMMYESELTWIGIWRSWRLLTYSIKIAVTRFVFLWESSVLLKYQKVYWRRTFFS